MKNKKLLAFVVAAIIILSSVSGVIIFKKRQYKMRVEPLKKQRRTEQKQTKRRDISELLDDMPIEKNPSIDNLQFQFDTRDIFQAGEADESMAGDEISGNDITTGITSLPNNDGGSIKTLNGNYKLLGEFLATAYSGAEFNSDGITKAGTNVRLGVIAVDPEVIKLGSVLMVEGYGEAVAEDTGNMIKGKHIDVWLPTVQEARRYGKKRVKVWLNKKREARPPFNN